MIITFLITFCYYLDILGQSDPLAEESPDIYNKLTKEIPCLGSVNLNTLGGYPYLIYHKVTLVSAF